MEVVKFIISPFTKEFKEVKNFVMKTHVPYSDDEVVIKINPNIQSHNESIKKENVEVRQATVSSDTEDTKTLKFNFSDKNKHNVEIEGRNFEIKLIDIGEEKVKEDVEQKFKYFKFSVKEK